MPDPLSVRLAKRRARQAAMRKLLSAGDKEMRRVVSAAKRRVEQTILRAARRGNFIRSARIRDTLYKDIAKIYASMQEGVDALTDKTAVAVARDWRKYAIADLPAAQTKGLTWGRFSKKHMVDILADITPERAPGLAVVSPQVARMYSADVRRLRSAFVDVQREGAIAGLSVDQMAVEMGRRVTAANPNWAFIDKAGKRWNKRSYFYMLNRTTNMNTARDAYLATMVDAKQDLAIIDGFLSDDSHEGCIKWQGEIVSVSGTDKKHPPLQQAIDDGLFHPNCVHYLSVVFPDEVEEEKKKGEETKDRQLDRIEEQEAKKEAA
jgi:hypothetical protein